MHGHQHRPRSNNYRKQYRRKRVEQIMEQAERRAWEAVRKPPKRPRMPRDEQDW